MSYSTPKSPAFFEYEEKRSRFITYLEPVTSRAQALLFLESLRERYPDARHHCWAYIVGDPRSASELAFSDDGEPSGTAGKPMLNVLQHRLVGDCMVVVVRYFGGVKLGAGGLVRAYSASVSQVVDTAELAEYIPQVQCRILCDFDQESHLRRWVLSFSGDIVAVEYAASVTVEVALPEANLPLLVEKIQGQGRGRMRVLTQPV